MEGSEIEALVDSLEALVSEVEGGSGKWKDIWVEVRSIGKAFKGSRFPSSQDRQQAWGRFQSVVGHVKECQNRAREVFEERERESEDHLDQILTYADRATPSSAMDDVIITLATGGLSVLVREGISAILGPFDERKSELRHCSQQMKEGWAYLSRNKGSMLGKHKQRAFEALKEASESLDAEWKSWKEARQDAFERFHTERQAAQEERQAKREAWEERIRANISKLEDRLDRLEDALGRRRGNLSKLEDMRDSAWSDDFRDRVDGWINEEEDRIEDIEQEIGKIKGWISDSESKLG